MSGRTPATAYVRPHYAPGVAATIPPPTGNLWQVLQASARAYPDVVAIDFLGKCTTYRQLLAAVEQAAGALAAAGVRRGDVVALCLPNCPQHVVAFYAVLRLGAIVAEHNPLAPASQHRAQLARHGARVIIAWENAAAAIAGHDPGLTLFSVNLAAALPVGKQLALHLPVARAHQMRAKLRARPPAFARPWGAGVRRAPAPPPPPTAVEGAAVAVLLHTGGTTGEPKTVMLSHANLRANVSQALQWVPHLNNGAEVFLTVLPFFHAFGLTFNLLCAVGKAATQLMFPTFDVELLLPALQRRPATFCVGVPVMFERLLQASQTRGVSLSTLHTAVSGAMALPSDLARSWEAATGGLIVAGYGMTETSPIVSGSPLTAARRPDSLGVPFASTDVRIVDETGTDVAPGQPGELLIRGPQVCLGYLHDPAASAALIDADGWLHTGDIVREEDHFLYLVDRRRELIIVNGFNVYPSAVEAALSGHPTVKEVAVVGLPRGAAGEDVVAVVVPQAGATPTLDQLRATAARELPHYALPRRLELVEALPRNEIGKLQRRLVRESLR